MIKFISLIAMICLPAQALQILQPDNGHEIVKHQSQALDETSELSGELLLTKLEKSAKSGNARAQFSLANMYHNGIGVKADEKLAFYWYIQVAEQGFASAQFNVANGYYHGIGTTQNLAQALTWYEKAAEQDFVAAQYNLAVMYRRGEGTDIDNEAAFRWYERAAQLGYGLAQLTLAKLYEKGVGVEQSDTLAQTWYLRAANQLDPEAQFHLAEFYQQRSSYAQAVFYYRKAAEQDYILAQFALAMNFLDGKGVIKDEEKAQSLLLTAAKAGHAQAQFQLGKLLYSQEFTIEAKQWLTKASEQSVDLATALLLDLETLEQSKKDALALEIADITPPIVESIEVNEQPTIKLPIVNTPDNKSDVAGMQTVPDLTALIPNQQQILESIASNTAMMNNVEKLMLSAQQGNPVAQHNLSTLYSIGELVTKDERKAFLLMQQSANQNIARSQNSLAMMYLNGIGVETNYQKAYYWASASARQGNAEGKQLLVYLVSGSF